MKTKPSPVSLKTPAPVQLVLGVQWGDEGKGKVVDLFAESYGIVARYQGGANAGHTVKIGGETFILHLIPSGILWPHTRCVIGNGVVVDPEALVTEITFLEGKNISVRDRLFISMGAHLILPYHKQAEKSGESEGGRIGTTGRGIGPAYADKMHRIGVRMADLLHDDVWPDLVKRNVRAKNKMISNVSDQPVIDEKDIVNRVATFAELAKPMIIDATSMLRKEIDKGTRVLIEGAQGALLDIDFGTYPFVTSSNTTIGGAATGLGIDPRKIDRVVGVCKAYTTRVGNGPFPSEIIGGIGDELRQIGGEFGATTGRPRRCGWFDALVVRHAVQTSGVDALVITKLDVLDTFKEIKICMGYKIGNQVLSEFPADMHLLDHVETIEESMPGWNSPIQSCLKYGDLPDAARKYLDRLQELTGVPIGIVSVGSGREETIWC